MLRTLVVTLDPAWPPVSGVDLRNWQNAIALADLGPVTVASVVPAAEAGPPPQADIGIVGLTEVGDDRDDALARQRTSIDRKLPKAAVSRLLALAGDLRPDLVVVEGVSLHPLLPLLRPHARILVLDMHNVESDFAGQVRDSRRGPAGWLTRLLDRDPERIREVEAVAAGMVDQVWLCSAADRQKLASITGSAARLHVVPNGVPRPEAFSSALSPAPRGGGWPVMVFVGHLSYGPNVGAVRRLAGAILPLVRRRFPQSRLVVAGRRPASRIRRLAARGALELVENPVTVTPCLAQAHVAVVPLAIGGGTRFKILEAMAAGVPVVATPLAAEGLDLADGIHVVLARTDAEIVSGVETLCTDPDRWQRQRDSARRHAIDLFGPAAISRAVREALGAE